MCHTALLDAKFHAFLLRIDEDLAAATRARACRRCRSRHGVIRELHSNIPQQEGEFLQEMVRRYRPQTTLEVGCAYGIASLYICEALREVGGNKHIVIDPYQHYPHRRGLAS